MAIAKLSLNREILRLAVPNIVSNLTVPLLGMADFALMGHLKQDSVMYVGAVALGTTVFNVLYMSLGFLRMGTSGFTAQSYGARDKKALHLGLHRSLLVALLLALLLMVLQYPIQWIAFRLLDGTTQVTHFARQYFYIRIYAAPATLMLYSFYGWYLGMQNARIPMTIAIVVNTMNIGLNFLFVFGFGMHSNGVALASVLAQYTGLLLAFWFLKKKYAAYYRRIALKLLVRKEGLLVFFKVNGDIFIRTLLLIFVLTFFTGVSARIGDNILAVNTLLFQFFFFFSYFADGFAFAGEALAGKARGSGHLLLLKVTVRQLFVWGLGIAMITSLVYFAGLKTFMHILTNDKTILQLAGDYRWWVIVLPLTSIAAFIWDGIYVGVTASKAMRNTMILSSLLIFLPAFYLLYPHWGNHGLWIALQLFMIARGLSMWALANQAVYKL
jgi:MATE family multidrug resistance protein